MIFKDLANWIKHFFVEVKHEVYVQPTKPVEPWPFPCVTGTPPKGCCSKKPTVKKATTRKTVVKDKAIKEMRKAAPKNETAKKAATKRARKAK